MPFVEVAVNSGLPHRQTFSYAVPEGMALQPGDGVFVPFGRRFLQGIVMEVVEVPAFAGPKPVDGRMGDRPVIGGPHVELARWVAGHYLSPLFPAVALMLPPGFERRPLTYYESLLKPSELASARLPPRQRAVLEYLVEHGRTEAKELEKDLIALQGRASGPAPIRATGIAPRAPKRLNATGVSAALSQLAQRGLLSRTYGMARPGVRAKTLRYVRLIAPRERIEPAIEELSAGRQGRLVKALQMLLDAPYGLPASELRLRAGASLPSLRSLAESMLIEVYDEAVERDPLAGRNYERREGPPLTAEQARVFEVVSKAIGGPHPNPLPQGEGTRRNDQRVLATDVGRLAAEVARRRAWLTAGEAADEYEAPPRSGARGMADRQSWASVTGEIAPARPLSPAKKPLPWVARSQPDAPHDIPSRPSVEPGTVIRAEGPPTDGRVFLLHGVTGSGKTEIYLRALEQTVALGKRAIVMVPEIALTPQTVRRFAERFPNQVAVLHSGLSQGELFDQWYGIQEGRYAVVIGSRSAVFAPQPDIGLIVIDEEHEWTYKQNDPAPRYDARLAAEKLAELTGAVLVLGSATPDVLTYQRALWGQIELIELKERVRPVFSGTVQVGVQSSDELPAIDVVDMRDELKAGNRSIFSRSLQLELYRTLSKGEQAILFLNRRGTAGFLQCRDCGFVPQCSSCAIALGYHKHIDSNGREVERLLCHQCNKARRPFETCPMCGGPRLRPMGLGVERVEESVHEAYPEARTLRWDRDVTQGRHAHEQILASFLKGDADVLIGTQMVAKGLDLPSVTLVGVISADIGLHIPDFRSAERTFQLLTQVAGRAGRSLNNDGGPPRGSVVIQTYTPENYAIVAAAQHDYAQFFATEIALRREEAYPPFVRLARLIFSATNFEYGETQAERVVKQLQREASQRGLPGVSILGPAPPFIPKWRGRYRWQAVVRSPDPVELLRDVKLPDGWTIDIDPASLA